jgi:serine/threonine protein kinase
MAGCSKLENTCINIGEGTFGIIYASNRENVVGKKYKTPGFSSSFLVEVSALTLLAKHGVVPQIVHIEVGLYNPIIFMETYTYNLDQYTIYKRVDLYQARSILYQILMGLYHTHRAGLIHRDIKPANILINPHDYMKVVICDWGSSQYQGYHTDDEEVQSLFYRSPESMVRNGNYTSKIDIWGVGCIFYVMLVGESPVKSHDELSGLMEIFRLLGTPADFQTYFPNFTEPIIPRYNHPEILTYMLTLDPITRPDVVQVLEHPFFDSIRCHKLEPLASSEVGASVPKLPFHQAIADRSRVRLLTRRATSVAHILYQNYLDASQNLPKLGEDIDYINMCVVMAARAVDFRFMNEKIHRDILVQLFPLFNNDFFRFDLLPVVPEISRPLRLPAMLAKARDVELRVKSKPRISSVRVFQDHKFKYLVYPITKEVTEEIDGILLTHQQCMSIGIILSPDWVHLATFDFRKDLLLFRAPV